MTVFVDNVRFVLGGMIMCHMWADTLDELLEMVDKVGVDRKWLQGHPTLSTGKYREASWVHFDVSLSKKNKAIAAGAVLTDKYGPVEHTARLDIATGRPEAVARGKKKLAMVAKRRKQKEKNRETDAICKAGSRRRRARPPAPGTGQSED